LNCLEIAAFIFALPGTPVTKPMFHLYDNQALLKAVERWVGEGGKATLVRAPDADVVREAIKKLLKNINSRISDFWGQSKSALRRISK